MSFGVDVKALLFEKVQGRVREYENETRIATRYKPPLLGYVYAYHPFFDEFYERQICKHPKQVFRPGNTVIVYFVPFADDITESNRGGDNVSEAWARAVSESVMLSAHINGTLRETLNVLGHDTSGTNLPGDWQEELCGPEWSHKHSAFLAGLGNFGTAGAFHTEAGFAGCFGSVITSLLIEPSKEWSEEELMDKVKICDGIDRTILNARPGKTAACPSGAISEKGFDKFICREFCGKQEQPAPLPDVCGKCFFV